MTTREGIKKTLADAKDALTVAKLHEAIGGSQSNIRYVLYQMENEGIVFRVVGYKGVTYWQLKQEGSTSA